MRGSAGTHEPSRISRLLGGLRDCASRLERLEESFLELSAAPSEFKQLPRFIYHGADGGGEPIRLGFFSGIHGDEPAGAWSLVALLNSLEGQPELGRGYELFFYPICNPWGFARHARNLCDGRDLNREFWRGSAAPEVRALEQEILTHHFHGLLSLHSDDTSDGIYGFVRGAVLAKALLEPALKAAEGILPRNWNTVIDGFPASKGVITMCYEGILTAPDNPGMTPFEIIFETPQRSPQELQVDATVRALETILREYQSTVAFAANL